jgi:hypothetical protein
MITRPRLQSKLHLSLLLVALAAAGLATPAQASILISAAEVGANVVISVSGSIDTTGLGSPLTAGYGQDPQVTTTGFSSGGAATAGLYALFSPQTVTGPATIASGTVDADSTTGLPFQFFSNDGLLTLPIGYVSGSAISTTATYNNKTLADFGWTTATNKVWSYSKTPSTITLTAVPEPGAIAMLAAGGVALAGGLIRRRLAAKV